MTDPITGFTGICTAIIKYYKGSTQVRIESKKGKDRWLPVERIILD